MRLIQPKNSWYLLMLLALPVLLLAATWGEGRPIYSPSTKAAGSDSVTFTSSTSTPFLFQVPLTYKLQEISESYVIIQNSNNEPYVEVTAETDLGDFQDNVTQFSINRYKAMHETEWMDEVANKKLKNTVVNSRSYSFTNPNGVKGYEIYLTVESKDIANGKIEQRGEVGPLFAFDMAEKNTLSPVIFAHGYGGNEEERLEILKTIADTLRFK